MGCPSRIFDALGNQVRSIILELLAQKPRSVRDMAGAVSVTRSAVSQHLKILKDSGLIQEARSGRRNIYALVPSALDAITEYVDHIRSLRSAQDGAPSDLPPARESKGCPAPSARSQLSPPRSPR
jgi:DNA-binding transcriptional ArsR family regulator